MCIINQCYCHSNIQSAFMPITEEIYRCLLPFHLQIHLNQKSIGYENENELYWPGMFTHTIC